MYPCRSKATGKEPLQHPIFPCMLSCVHAASLGTNDQIPCPGPSFSEQGRYTQSCVHVYSQAATACLLPARVHFKPLCQRSTGAFNLKPCTASCTKGAVTDADSASTTACICTGMAMMLKPHGSKHHVQKHHVHHTYSATHTKERND